MEQRMAVLLRQDPSLQAHSEEEICQVIQALAESGYPDPSPEDIKRVFRYAQKEQLSSASTTDSASSSAQEPVRAGAPGEIPAADGAAEAETDTQSPQPNYSTEAVVSGCRDPVPSDVVDAPRGSSRRGVPPTTKTSARPTHRAAWDPNTSLGEPPKHSRRARDAELRGWPSYSKAPRGRWGAVGEPTSSLGVLSPSVRLERYIKRYERALSGFYERHPHISDETAADAVPPTRGILRTAHNPPGGAPLAVEHDDLRVSGAPARKVLAMPLHVSSPAEAPSARRAANVVFDHTGDPRYRYHPPLEAPPTATVPLSGASGRLYTTSAVERRRGHPLSSLAVGHLQADGSTLTRRSDPVKRGEQMRAIWRRDRFLSSSK